MSHSHDHIMPSYGRLFAIGIGLNVFYVAIEAFYGWHVESLALLADAGHNFSDIAGLLLAWAAMAASKIKASEKHSYGWKKATIFASFLNAVILLVAMGGLAWEAILRINSGVEMQAVTIIWVASIGVVINAITAWLFIRGSKEDLNIRGAFLHMAADTLVSLGVVISGLIYLKWQWYWLDPMISLIIVAVVIATTWSLFHKSLHLLFDGVPDNVDAKKIRHYFDTYPEIESFHDLHIWALSTTENSLSVHVIKRDDTIETAQLLLNISHDLHQKFHINHVTIQVETVDFSNKCYSINCTPNNITIID